MLIRHLERVAADVARRSGYREIRTPLFEETGLFHRSLGEASDVVEKEMFTVPRRTSGGAADSGKASDTGGGYTFRPEGTAGVVRAYIQGGFAAKAPFQKWFYIGPMFRYERPQKGRERQFTQFGVEAFGACSPSLDAEVIRVALGFFEQLGFGPELEVRLNSMGDGADREAWREVLRQFFAPQFGPQSSRCGDCQARFERNILRLLDCKVPSCIEQNQGAPELFTVMNEEAKQHHQDLMRQLEALGKPVREDRSIVRGLDYYTRTVFEIHYPPLGARSALCGGGRYDGLVADLGGKPTAGVGFSIGFTPTELALAELGLPPAQDLQDLQQQESPQVYAIAVGEEDRLPVLQLVQTLRDAGLRVDLDHLGKAFKKQFKEAGRCGARYALVLGSSEREAGEVVVKDLVEKQEVRVKQQDLVQHLRGALA